MILDELDAHFHPLLSKKIITLFHAQTNQKFAQLLFITHDTHLLDAQMMRRDQIYFVEKNQKGESSFYSLADFKFKTIFSGNYVLKHSYRQKCNI
ncbi:MAG: hypothetical protein RL329_828 [Bacteroidota bacterium]